MNIKKITSVQNTLIKHLAKLVSSKKYRHDCNSVIVEGVAVISELQEHVTIKTLLTVDERIIPNNLTASSIFLVQENIINKISATKSAPKLIAEIQIPNFQSLKNKQWILALDRIQDPGNLGTLIRTALAFGWQGIFLLKGCCDLWNDKVIRSAKGALFKIPIQTGSFEELQKLVLENQLPIFAADIKGIPAFEINEKNGTVLVLGSEGQGLCPAVDSFCKKITLPMTGNMESLNVSVAGGILMYVLKAKNQ